MGTLDLLAGARLDRMGRQIRSRLAGLRRRKLILATANTQPARNPALDPMLGELRSLRVRLEFQIRKVEVEQSLGPAEGQVLARAREILGDASEMIDLLLWFGAEMPAGDTDADQNSGDPVG